MRSGSSRARCARCRAWRRPRLLDGGERPFGRRQGLATCRRDQVCARPRLRRRVGEAQQRPTPCGAASRLDLRRPAGTLELQGSADVSDKPIIFISYSHKDEPEQPGEAKCVAQLRASFFSRRSSTAFSTSGSIDTYSWRRRLGVPKSRRSFAPATSLFCSSQLLAVIRLHRGDGDRDDQ